jgi:hypothetical protein
MARNILFALIFLICLISHGSNAQTSSNEERRMDVNRAKPKPDFTGNWSWTQNNKHETFTLEIVANGDKLYGSYCSIARDGNRIDCSDEETSFIIPIPDTGSFITTFTSYYSMTKGKIKITVKGKNLIWEVIESPKGEFYCPQTATLIRD